MLLPLTSGSTQRTRLLFVPSALRCYAYRRSRDVTLNSPIGCRCSGGAPCSAAELGGGDPIVIGFSYTCIFDLIFLSRKFSLLDLSPLPFLLAFFEFFIPTPSLLSNKVKVLLRSACMYNHRYWYFRVWRNVSPLRTGLAMT